MASNQIMNAQPGFLETNGTNGCLNEHLWKLCAGSLIDIPKVGEKVYYFPQGHIEHLATSINDDLCQIKPIFNIPSKFPCSVVSIELKVEPNTNEVYAEVSLLPDNASETEVPIPSYNDKIQNINYFTKVLSASDTNTHGSLVLLKRHAIECLPPLDMSQPTPNQEIFAKDLHGHEWRFKHIFKGTPKRHLFTSGWIEFAREKKLVAGDSFIFIRGEDGESRVGIRKASYKRDNISSSLFSKQSMHHGVITTAWNAIETKCMFVVFYKPRLSQFIVNFEKVVNAMKKKFHIGSRFTMRYEGGEFNEIRYSGTIVGMRDFSIHWRDSDWRSIEVQWDEATSTPRPDKVSPWEIEPLLHLSNTFEPTLLKNKRQRGVHKFGSNMWIPTLSHGQEIGQSSTKYPMIVPKLSYQNNIDDSKFPSDGLISYSDRTMSKPNYNDQMVLSMKDHSTTNSTASCLLFGVDLMIPTETKDHMGQIDSSQKSKMSKISEEKKLDQIQNLTSLKEIHDNINSTRRCTKVHMQGVAIEKTVELTVLDEYNKLVDELENLFDLKGELHMRNQWEIIFTDEEGDVMLVGDDPWLEFRDMVKEIFIRLKEDVKMIQTEKKSLKRTHH